LEGQSQKIEECEKGIIGPSAAETSLGVGPKKIGKGMEVFPTKREGGSRGRYVEFKRSGGKRDVSVRRAEGFRRLEGQGSPIGVLYLKCWTGDIRKAELGMDA